MSKKDYSNEAYVYWFYNKYTFETYFGSRAAYKGSYKDDFLKRYNSSSENEKFLKALENDELVGEVIAVFTGKTYEEVKYAAYVYEQVLIYLSWEEFGTENSYNHSCWYDGHLCNNPFYRDYLSGKDSPFWKEIDIEEVKRLSSEKHLTLEEISHIVGLGLQALRERCKSIGFDYYKKDTKKENNPRYIDVDFNKILDLHEKGLTTTQIGYQLNISGGVVLNRLKDKGIKPNKKNYNGNKNPSHGTTWVTNGVEEKFMHSKKEAEIFLDKNLDWRIGQSDEHKRKNSEKGKGRKIQRKIYTWKTPTGDIRTMDKQNASKWHPDWVLVE